MASDVANDARSTIDRGGTQEAPATVAAVALMLASQNAPPQERDGDVDASLSTASPVSPQDSDGGGNATAVETSSSGMGAVPAPPRPSSASDPIPSPRPSLVGSATAPVVVKTNASGDDASPSLGLSSDNPSGHPKVNNPTVEALIKTSSSDSGVVDAHSTTSLRGASGVRRSQPPQDSSTVEQITVPATVDTGSSDTGAARVTAVPLNPLNTDRSATTGGFAAVDDSVILAVVDASSVGPGPVDEDVRAPALSGSSLPRPSPPHHSTSQASSGNQATSGPAVEVPSIPHGAAGCAATDQLQEVAELLKHAGNLLSRIGISNAQHVHMRPGDCKCTTCLCACTCTDDLQPPPSVSEVTGGARAASAVAVAANPAPTAVTSGKGGIPNNQAADSQDHPPPGPPPKDPQEIQQTSSAAQQVPPSQQAPPGQLTGWAAVEKALKDFDQQEIGGYKEDIDSLLTFTGLYSAVLTAFVIVSYPLLQDQSPASGTMSTPSAAPSPFQPPITAIRINILWFASLVISLATASFAILVKQWLRAYMAFATASPQGQLRVRHFRRSGLTTWRVFGIASSLPLLLQISLALFFAGLCIFTWDVHPTLGKTTLPLVAAWAFLFLVVTVAPSFTACCPYTTPALARITCALRTHVYPLSLSVIRKHIPYCAAWSLYKTLHWITGYWEFDLLGQFHSGHRRHTSFLLPIYKQLKASTTHFKELELPKPVEEVDVQKNARHDLRILAVADALQADDHLLGTTIKSALEQSNANWVQLLQFAVQIIGNRIPVVDSETSLERILSAYRSLSPGVMGVIEEIFQLHVIPKASELEDSSVTFPNNWQTITRWATCIIMQVKDPHHPFFSLDTSPRQVLKIKSQAVEKSTWQLKGLDLALQLCDMMTVELDDIKDIEEMATLSLVAPCLFRPHKGNSVKEKKFILQCLNLKFTAICQVIEAVYVNDIDIRQLANVIHSIVDYHSNDFLDLKAIEILKLSLLSVRVIYSKIHDNQDSRPRWSSVEAAQWKRTFIWLADRLCRFWPFFNLSPDELAALQQLARSGWGEIPDPTEDSPQQALPLPDYFYVILWRTTGEDLSQIPSQHPQLLRIAHMSGTERYVILDKGRDMAWAYRDHPGNLWPPGIEDENGDGVECTGTSAPPQGIQDPIPNDPRVGACELGVSGGLQQGLPIDISEVPSSESRAPLEAELRATETAEQCSWTNAEPAGGFQPGQTSPASHATPQDSGHIDASHSERLDSVDSVELHPAGNPAELAEGPENLACIAAHQASAEGGATSSMAKRLTTPASLPTYARDETGLAEAQDGSEVTADDVRAYPISDGAASSLHDAAGEDNSRRADDIAAGSSNTIPGSNAEPDPDRARADIVT